METEIEISLETSLFLFMFTSREADTRRASAFFLRETETLDETRPPLHPALPNLPKFSVIVLVASRWYRLKCAACPLLVGVFSCRSRVRAYFAISRTSGVTDRWRGRENRPDALAYVLSTIRKSILRRRSDLPRHCTWRTFPPRFRGSRVNERFA